jgi:putative molybdopterin biosynthesis protein
MPEQMMTTKEIAHYLGIHEKQVYALIKEKKIPATRVTGKWIFPKKIIDEWIESDARRGISEAREKSRRIEEGLLASGSNDPILDMLQTHMKKEHPEFYIFSANTGSMEGLKILNRGYTDIAWSHLVDPSSGIYNVPFLATHLPNLKAVVVNLFYRDLGFLVARKNPLKIRGFEDLTRKDVRFINRQAGSGTRLLLDDRLKKQRLPAAKIRGYEREAYTHFEVGLSILSQDADVGIATAAVSRLLGLSFIPITRESFDMILGQPTYFRKGVQAFMNVLQSGVFRGRVEPLGGYDFRDSGKIVHAGN